MLNPFKLLFCVVLFAADVLQMALEERQLRCLRVWVMEQSPILLTTPVRRPRLFCFSNPQQRGIFVLLKRCVTVLQRLNATGGRFLLDGLCCHLLSVMLGNL